MVESDLGHAPGLGGSAGLTQRPAHLVQADAARYVAGPMPNTCWKAWFRVRRGTPQPEQSSLTDSGRDSGPPAIASARRTTSAACVKASCGGGDPSARASKKGRQQLVLHHRSGRRRPADAFIGLHLGCGLLEEGDERALRLARRFVDAPVGSQVLSELWKLNADGLGEDLLPQAQADNGELSAVDAIVFAPGRW